MRGATARLPDEPERGGSVDLTVSTGERGALTVVHVGGEIDVYTAPLLREALDKQVSAGRVDLVVDLDEVTFMDSTGLGVLVGRLKLVRSQGGTLRIVSSQDRILKVFKITGLDKVFHIFASVDEATSPADVETAPSEVETAPSEVETAPSEVETAPSEVEAAPSEVETAPSGDPARHTNGALPDGADPHPVVGEIDGSPSATGAAAER
jgi:anti-sigma B factor antagonist